MRTTVMVLIVGLLTTTFLPIEAPAAGPKTPFIYCSDLFHPAMDPDDHFDLATVFAMKTLDIRAVILDNHIDRLTQDQESGGGRIPLQQMMHVTGRDVPWAIGLKEKLRSRDDRALDTDPRWQGGVQKILSVLRQSPEKVVIKLSTGADFAAAFNREPELIRTKVRAVYLHAGNGAGGAQKEYNVGLDPIGYERVFQSGVPIYWCPCFEGAAFKTPRDGYETYFKIPDQAAIFDVCVPGVRRFFAYAFARSKADPIGFLEQDSPIRLPGGARHMWSTPTLAHAAGLKIYRRGTDDYLFLAPNDAVRLGLSGNEVKPFEFVPVRVVATRVEGNNAPTDNAAPGTIRVEREPSKPNAMVFRQTDPDYGKIMNSCLKNLFSQLSR
ncbi:MAG: hypothetical protein ACOX1P_04370 [Thermoguttaceae bacterium]|jgi:hypothetical protein